MVNNLQEWTFNDLDPWKVIAESIQSCVSHSGNDSSDPGAVRGHSLILKLFTFIAETDLNNWFDFCGEEDKIDFQFKPFLVSVLCPKEDIGLSKNLLSLVKLYSTALDGNCSGSDLANIRKLVGLASQVRSILIGQ